MDSQMCDRVHHTHSGLAGLMIEHQGLAEKANTDSWGCRAVFLPGPIALEAFSQLPMAVRGSSKITQGVEEMPQCYETLSGLLSCSPIRLKPPWSHGYFPPGDCGAKIQGFVKEQECGGLGVGEWRPLNVSTDKAEEALLAPCPAALQCVSI